MLKRYFLTPLLTLLAASFSVHAQTGAVGIGTTAPDASAALDIVSSSKGLLLPRVASATAIANPAPGLLLYQTDAPTGFYYNTGTAAAPNWQQLATVGAPGTVASVTGFNGYISPIAAASSSYVFIGPTALITITSTSQKVVASATAPLGLFSGGPIQVQVGMCYQPTTGGAITNFAGSNYSIVKIAVGRVGVPATATVTGLAPGTYKVGFGVSNYNNTGTVINDTDFINGYVMVIN